ncbi:MAG TPA: deoxyribose-phosphate aldolase [Frankiaceae bacterium]|jgi:deoxyribose-phosphate aldolase|nr:deoxyribose-phosphate aldolase [Frankiaceae bacterium]
MVDHTLLKPEATQGQIDALCAEAEVLQTRTVCVNGLWVRAAAEQLESSTVDVCAVVGFPLGAMHLGSLLSETTDAIEGGAAEIDMVIPVGFVKGGAWTRARAYISAVRSAMPGDGGLKVILEAALLSDAELVDACKVSVDAGAQFVKTSTGFNAAGGATVHAVRLMRATVGPEVGVKAAGGIRTLSDALAMLDAGANRLGMSATRAVASELGR